MLRPGDTAPSFTGTTHDGRTLTLDEFRGKPLLLYFYPKASTAGCAAEAKGFAQNYEAFRTAGIAVVGVSVDTVEAQAQFARDCGLPFPLIADRDKTLARQYGVLGLLGFAKRTTFFVGADGRIEEIVQGMMPGPHVRRALERSGEGEPGPAPPAKP